MKDIKQRLKKSLITQYIPVQYHLKEVFIKVNVFLLYLKCKILAFIEKLYILATVSEPGLIILEAMIAMISD